MTSFLAIDPGDVHVGFALLERESPRSFYLSMGVLHRESRDFVDLVESLGTLAGRVQHVIVEDYRVRPVGHQRFNHGATLRLLGAIEYVVSATTSASFSSVAPGNSRDLEQLRLDRVLDAWRESFAIRPNATHWRHADSAWRALGMYASMHHWVLYEPIARATEARWGTLRASTPRHRFVHNAQATDLTIPSVHWAL